MLEYWQWSIFRMFIWVTKKTHFVVLRVCLFVFSFATWLVRQGLTLLQMPLLRIWSPVCVLAGRQRGRRRGGERFMCRALCDWTGVHAFIWLPFSPNPKAALAWFQLQDLPKLPRPTWNGLQSLTVTQSRSYLPSFTNAVTSTSRVYSNYSLLLYVHIGNDNSQMFLFSRGEKKTRLRLIKISYCVCHLWG